ncbi:MAG: intradiol ring-cleavage dioxygenase [Ilumatobacteraceae bacterium]|nr:intradiol ring-cleavage dioxygenase [Ilumatobacteraceae bacterium]
MSTDHDDFGGLARDLPLLLQRRHVLKMLAGSTLLALAACGSDSKTATSTAAAGNTTGTTGATTATIATDGSATTLASATDATAATADAASAATCAPINEETAGPYPGDGSNGPNVLTESGIVRSDITSSFGTSTTMAPGVPTTVTLTIQDTANGCSALANAAVYIWHCNQAGQYSMYSNGVTNENYLRGVQQTDANGHVTFKTIFPAAYSGRWPHMHFEVYSSVDDATGGGTPIATSQLAMPKDVCDVVFAIAGYEQSVSNLSQTSLSTDMVFSDDGAAHQIPTTTGSVADGYSMELTVPT